MIKRLRGGHLVRSVFVLVSGTAGVQAIGMLMMPVVTRLYGPEEFGVLGSFTAIAGILMPIAGLTFPVATVLGRTDNEARVISTLSITVSVVSSLIALVVMLLFGERLSYGLGYSTSPALYFIPLALFFSTLFQVNRQWAIRKGFYRQITGVGIRHAFLFNALKIVGGLLYPSHLVLICIFCMGPLFQSYMLCRASGMKNLKRYSSFSVKKLSFAVKKHRSFALYRAPQTALKALSESVPIILLSASYGTSSAGFYSLTRIALGMPIGLLGQSISDVLYPKFTSLRGEEDAFSKLLIKSSIILSVMGGIIYVAIYMFGPFIFTLAFGAEWEEAGEYAKWLSVGLFFMFVARPFIAVIPVLGLHRAYLIFEAMLVTAIIYVIYELDKQGAVAVDVVLSISILTGVGHVFLIFYVFLQVKNIGRSEE